MLKLTTVHHVAIICSDYETSKDFYTRILGFSVVAEHHRAERNSYKLDLALGDRYFVELFSFPNPPPRDQLRSLRLRHLAFSG
jgi:glyoxylase I family protein